MGRVVPVIVAGHCEEGLVSGGGNSSEGFDPHSDHPGFSEIDAVCILETHRLFLLGELESVWSLSWLKKTVWTC